ncbi:hypothetical protein COCC4DRAFT_33538 [Bipolaris maydis ATCC 48331]|uniref:Uncharacterized protein n=2 Tax=Cochliobolus heterostrophus TaxID=5016 RepID=M2SS97_COCH5|nr:uncharacterized protein COCC4DRAFT_33538 [Bipolaris maydis ATCC 48331]EMD88205.1 hypothetical protein COCHEDRAFT_1023376 [Bipolaris maydis C5]ENI02216.1 hypothetical protein COCC4DRAFT_33538 [Bipolaris maydis ATCC 48331]KAJ6207172.1 hypothetical protein PSV09DRAFT_1023376 [Bipolaris maydis]KAJ6268326.1 hypothetical protein PSV08DRAFT_353982 [Bipolaris maydis]
MAQVAEEPIRFLHLLATLSDSHCYATCVASTFDLVADTDSYWAVKRQRARLQYLVQILKEHADDQGKGSLLQHLTLDFRLTRIPGPRLLPLP